MPSICWRWKSLEGLQGPKESAEYRGGGVGQWLSSRDQEKCSHRALEEVDRLTSLSHLPTSSKDSWCISKQTPSCSPLDLTLEPPGQKPRPGSETQGSSDHPPVSVGERGFPLRQHSPDLQYRQVCSLKVRGQPSRYRRWPLSPSP